MTPTILVCLHGIFLFVGLGFSYACGGDRNVGLDQLSN